MSSLGRRVKKNMKETVEPPREHEVGREGGKKPLEDHSNSDIQIFKTFGKHAIQVELWEPSLVTLGRVRRVIVIYLYPREGEEYKEGYVWYYRQELDTPDHRRETIVEKVVPYEKLKSIIKMAEKVETYQDFYWLAKLVENA